MAAFRRNLNFVGSPWMILALSFAIGCKDGDSDKTEEPTTTLVILTDQLPTAEINQAFSAQLQAQGGSGQGYNWSVQSGELPGGINLSSDAEATLSGTPSVAGLYKFTVQVADDADHTASKELTLRVQYTPWVVYYADQEVDGRNELYGVELLNDVPAAPIKLNSSLAGSGTVFSAQWSPDGRWLAYFADPTGDNVLNLYVVDLGASMPQTPVQLNSQLRTITSRMNVYWSPDGQRLVYLANPQTSAQREAFLVDLRGSVPSTPVPISGTLAPGGRVDDVEWSPDGTHIALDTELPNGRELIVVDLRGEIPAPPRRINEALPDGLSTYSNSWSPRGTSLSYRVWPQGVGGPENLYVAELSGTAPWPSINVTNFSAAEEGVREVIWSPDGSGILYIADAPYDLYLVRRDPQAAFGAPVRINPDSVVGIGVSEMAWHPDSNRILYLASQEVSKSELYLTSSNGGVPTAPVKVNAPILAGGSVWYNRVPPGFDWTAGGAGILYYASQSSAEPFELFYAGFEGSAPLRVNGNLPGPSAKVYNYYPRPAEPGVAYIADQDVEGVLELYYSNLGVSPAAAVKINAPLGVGGQVTQRDKLWNDKLWATNGRFIAYTASQETPGVSELYLVSFATGSPSAAIKISGAMVANGNVISDPLWRP